MKIRHSFSVLASAAAVQAHYTFPVLGSSAAWEYVRMTANHWSYSPVSSVTSPDMRCYEIAAGAPGATTTPTKTMAVTAGQSLNFNADPSIQHPGPMSVWIAKVPDGQTIEAWDGSGPVWSKIYQDAPVISGSGITWPAQGKPGVNFTIPACLANGDYLLRAEHIGLHGARSEGGSQPYVSCAQIRITGGTGTYRPKSQVAIPGHIDPKDPGVLIDIYWPVPTSYSPPGGPAETCDGDGGGGGGTPVSGGTPAPSAEVPTLPSGTPAPVIETPSRGGGGTGVGGISPSETPASPPKRCKKKKKRMAPL